MGLLRRSSSRRPRPATGRPQAPASIVAEPVGPASDAAGQLLVEVVAAAMLVGRGAAARVVVCNAPATIDFDELRLIADRYSVGIDPIVRVGGGGVDLAVVPRAASRG